MRTFIVPPQLTTPGAREFSKGPVQTAAVFAALVGEEDTIIITDHNRLTRLTIMSRSSHWTAGDLEKESVVSDTTLSKCLQPVERFYSTGLAYGLATTVLIGSMRRTKR